MTLLMLQIRSLDPLLPPRVNKLPVKKRKGTLGYLLKIALLREKV
jgi:hypothetical protein